MDISLVIPAYNERDNVEALVDACTRELEAHDGRHEILLIDDGSTDGTGERLRELAAENPLVRLIEHPPGRNIGCHPSELEGMRAAKGEVALFLPADLQILPSELTTFLAGAQSGDIVASHRVARADARWRRWLSAANNRLERALMGVDVHDAHSSMLLNRRAIDTVAGRVVSNSALIPAEILVRGAAAGLRISEVEIRHYPRAAGRQTGAKPSEILRVQWDLLRLRVRLRSELRAA